jgi:hypothetical protein
MLGLLLTLFGLCLLLGFAWGVVRLLIEEREVRWTFLMVAGVGVYCFLPALLPEPWGVWTFFGLAALGILTGIVAVGLKHFRVPRSVSVGRGRWRLIAWGQLRFSPRVHGILALAIALGLTLGSWELIRWDPRFLVIIYAVVVAIGMVAAIAGMVRAWREGERHRWPEQWSEMPPDDVTGSAPGLVPQGPRVPAPSAAAAGSLPARSVAGHGGRPR